MVNSAIVAREARLRAGLTQQELAERLDTTQSVVSRWESGRVVPSAEKLSSIVEACGLELHVRLMEADAGHASLIERTLRLTPEQRLEELVRAVEFIRAGRSALEKRLA